MTGKDDALAALARNRSRIEQARRRLSDLERQQVELVAACRGADPQATWQEIADALRILQPNAVKKFKPLLEETVQRQVRVKDDTGS